MMSTHSGPTYCPVPAAGDDDEKEEEADRRNDNSKTLSKKDDDEFFIVVKKTFPSPENRDFSELFMLSRTTFKISKNSFPSKDEAVRVAVQWRKRSPWFDEDDDDEEDLDLPYDLWWTPGPDKVLIDVMTKSEYKCIKEERKQKLETAKSEQSNDAATEDGYIVVKTTYPSVWGCNYGSFEEPKWRTVVKSKTFTTYDEAAYVALIWRKKCDWFDGCEGDDDDELPFNSADLQNYDNDEEVLIDVECV